MVIGDQMGVQKRGEKKKLLLKGWSQSRKSFFSGGKLLRVTEVSLSVQKWGYTERKREGCGEECPTKTAGKEQTKGGGFIGKK